MLWRAKIYESGKLRKSSYPLMNSNKLFNINYAESFVSLQAPYSPEKALVAAIMLRAIEDLLEPSEYKKTMCWFEYKGKESDFGFTFKQCCHILGWDREVVMPHIIELYDFAIKDIKRQTAPRKIQLREVPYLRRIPLPRRQRQKQE